MPARIDGRDCGIYVSQSHCTLQFALERDSSMASSWVRVVWSVALIENKIHQSKQGVSERAYWEAQRLGGGPVSLVGNQAVEGSPCHPIMEWRSPGKNALLD